VSELETPTVEPFEGKRLFTVEIEQTIVVLASDDAEAEEIATEAASCGGGVDWNDANYAPIEVEGRLPPDWLKAIPFGIPRGMKEQTCAQILAAWAEYEAARLPTAAELEAMGQQRLT
jgi:hypothetical protein